MASKTANYTILRGEFRDGKTVHKVGDTISLPVGDGARHVATGDLAEAPADAKPANKSEDPYGLPKTLEPVEGRDIELEIPGSDGKWTAVGHVLKAAFDRSELTVKQWNDLGEDEIEARLKAELAEFAAFVNS
jgi:hypothetical protein